MELDVGDKITIARWQEGGFQRPGRLRFILARVTAVDLEDDIVHFRVHQPDASFGAAHGELPLDDEGRKWIRGWNQNDWPMLRAAWNLTA